MEENNLTEWTPNSMLEIVLNEPDDFLKVRETLTRIGVASRKDKKLYQSCHILHKQGRYFIVHFKELFLLDGKKSDLEESDIARRNTIAQLMSDWGLITIDNNTKLDPLAPLRQIKIISFKESEISISTIFSIREKIVDDVRSPYSASITYSPYSGIAELMEIVVSNSPSTVNKLPLSICLPVGSVIVNFILS